MRKVHDRGGWPNEDPIDHDEHEMEEWERQVDALNSVLGEKDLKTLTNYAGLLKVWTSKHTSPWPITRNGPQRWRCF